MPNRLAHETSPYLLQHANNPVDWYPWCDDALARARAEDRPIFLSIGYSACHWCHVMEHESFENDAIAAQLNEHFVCIKVDREERPDLDQIYMQAVQLLTGHGGWPMSVFLTPDLRPFHGGTYWPPEPRRGMQGFSQVLDAVLTAWRERREQVDSMGQKLTLRLQDISRSTEDESQPTRALLQAAEARLEQAFDFTHGGFGRAPKFPHPMDLQLLLRNWLRHPRDGVLEMVRLNLDKMARGGIYDHLGGGFARYSVDDRWLVPHFEKMLYDNALLAGAYLDGYVVTGEGHYATVVRETLDYVLRDMTDDRGGFYSTEDADSEGEEGKFYVWTPEEVERVLGPERGRRFCYVFDVTDTGNFEGRSILNLPKTIDQCASLRGWDVDELVAELAKSRAELLQARERRVHPGKDDKVLVSWNGLMIDSLARAAGVLRDSRYLTAAARAAEFILREVRGDDGRLLHCWRHGQARFSAYLDDYAYLINALTTLYEAQFEERWIDEAVRLADLVIEHFVDHESGGFFFTADDHETLIARTKDMHDSSVPSSNGMAATALWRLGKLCGRQEYLDQVDGTLRLAKSVMQQFPTASGQMLIALDMYLGPYPEIVVLADPQAASTSTLFQDLRQRYLPNRALAYRSTETAYRSSHLDPIFQGKQPRVAEPTVFVCENFACETPVTGHDKVIDLWNRLAVGRRE